MDFCLGPFEGCRLLVPTGDKGFDCLDEPADAGEVFAPQSATAKDAKLNQHSKPNSVWSNGPE